MRNPRAVWADGALHISHPDHQGGLQTSAVCRLRGIEQVIPVAEATLNEGVIRLTGAAADFAAVAVWSPRSGTRCAWYDVAVTLRYTGAVPADAGVEFNFAVMGAGRPTWLIPGAFYKENRLPHCTRIYPRYDWEGGEPQALVSDTWSFRSDRAALPAVFAWNQQCCAAVATAETSAVGMSGVGLSGNAAGASIWLNFPYREEPVVFEGPGQPGPADCPLYRWAPEEAVTLNFRVYVAGPDLHAYDPFVRELYDLDRQTHHLKPWMGIRQAAELTAHGLYRWHYRAGDDILLETAAFDRELNASVKGQGDRPNMHVGWVSGAPYAYALLAYGREHGRTDYTQAAARVLDKISTGITPAGFFWGEWRGDRGWSQGWTPNKGWVQARTIGEATLFMLRALHLETAKGFGRANWRQAVLSNLRYITSIQREDGSFGAYYFAETGEVKEWEGAGGLIWIPVLLEAADQFPEEAGRFRAAAVRAGQYYRRFVEDEFIYGAPEDVHLTPTSEDGYNAVMAYVRLFEQTHEPEWLRLAARAADWTMTFRWTYNLAFPPHTMLAQFDFRSRGADQASPSNQHLHNYGLICLPEMMRLWRYTGDDYYLERTRDNLACFLQFIARADGDFNAYKGMVTERYYNTNCFQPKGMLLTLSVAWCVGVILYAAQAAVPYEEALGL